MKFLVKVFIFIFLFISTQTVIFAKKTMTSDHFRYSISFPDSWVTLSRAADRRFVVGHPQGIATVNVTPYFFSEAVTLNQFKLKHSRSRYDGWQILLDRFGTSVESSRANVSESAISVYSRPIDSLPENSQSQITGEYYFLKSPVVGYVVSVDCVDRYWPNVQADFREIIASFHIPSTANIPMEFTQAISLEGANRSMTISDFSSSLPLRLSTTLGLALRRSIFEDYPPVFFGDSAFYSRSGTVVRQAIPSGNIIWKYPMMSGMGGPLVVSDELSFFVKRTTSTELVALQNASGALRWQLPLTSHMASPLTIVGQSLFVIDNTVLKQIDSYSGTLISTTKTAFSSVFPPIIYKDIAVAHTDSGIQAIRLKSKLPIWSSIEPPLKYPLALFQDTVLIPYPREISSMDINTGQVKWTVPYPFQNSVLKTPISVLDTALIFGIKFLDFGVSDSQHSFEIVALNPRTGALLWHYPFSHLASYDFSDFCITSQYVFFSQMVSGKQVINALNSQSGDISPPTLSIEFNRLQSIESIQSSGSTLFIISNDQRSSSMWVYR